VTIEANANAEGHLYGSVGPAEVSQAAAKEPARRTRDGAHGVAHQGSRAYAVKLHLGYEIESEVKVLDVRPEKK
jgi:large subunit ribosomal protein L9